MLGKLSAELNVHPALSNTNDCCSPRLFDLRIHQSVRKYHRIKAANMIFSDMVQYWESVSDSAPAFIHCHGSARYMPTLHWPCPAGSLGQFHTASRCFAWLQQAWTATALLACCLALPLWPPQLHPSITHHVAITSTAGIPNNRLQNSMSMYTGTSQMLKGTI